LRRFTPALVLLLTLLPPASAGDVSIRALAVAELPDGTLVGSTSTMTIRILPNGSGNV